MFRQIGAFYPLHVLDVGSARTALPAMMRNCGPLVTATDKSGDYWQYGVANRHYYVVDDDICETTLTERFDLVTCISVLEQEYWQCRDG